MRKAVRYLRFASAAQHENHIITFCYYYQYSYYQYTIHYICYLWQCYIIQYVIGAARKRALHRQPRRRHQQSPPRRDGRAPRQQLFDVLCPFWGRPAVVALRQFRNQSSRLRQRPATLRARPRLRREARQRPAGPPVLRRHRRGDQRDRPLRPGCPHRLRGPGGADDTTPPTTTTTNTTTTTTCAGGCVVRYSDSSKRIGWLRGSILGFEQAHSLRFIRYC